MSTPEQDALFRVFAQRLESGALTSEQAKATLTLFKYQPNSVVRLFPGNALAALDYLKSLAKDMTLGSAGYLIRLVEAAREGKAPTPAAFVKTKDSAEKVMEALRDAPGIYKSLENSTLRFWVQSVRKLAEETGTDEELGLPPPPVSQKLARELDRSESAEILMHWMVNQQDAATYAAVYGPAGVKAYETLKKNAVMPAIPMLDAIFYPTESDTSLTEYTLLGAGAIALLGLLGYVGYKSWKERTP